MRRTASHPRRDASSQYGVRLCPQSFVDNEASASVQSRGRDDDRSFAVDRGEIPVDCDAATATAPSAIHVVLINTSWPPHAPLERPLPVASLDGQPASVAALAIHGKRRRDAAVRSVVRDPQGQTADTGNPRTVSSFNLGSPTRGGVTAHTSPDAKDSLRFPCRRRRSRRPAARLHAPRVT